MDEAPAYLAAHSMTGHHNSLSMQPYTNGKVPDDFSTARSHLFCFSSIERLGVRRVMNSYLDYLESAETPRGDDFLKDFSYTLGCRRSNMEWKGVIVANSTEELVSKLKSADQGSFKRSTRDKAPSICFVFCGQGSQWAGMGRDLIGFEAFRESLSAASYFMSIYLGSQFNLLDELFATEENSRISEPDVSQPATTALQVALVDLLSALSIKPNYVVGHSSGEIAAAYASGSITREAAWEIAYWRGAAAASLGLKAPRLEGRMLAVGMSLEEANAYIEPAQRFVQVACINSPRSVTLSGRADKISFIAEELRDKGVFSRMLPVKTAYHSDHMKLVENDYRKRIAHVEARKHRPSVTMLSSLTGQTVDGEQLEASYWVNNMLSPVNFLGAVREMTKLPAPRRPSIFVEIGPRASLRTPTLDILTDADSSLKPIMMSALERGIDGETSFLQVVGDLWARGYAVDLKYAFTRSVCRHAPKCLTDLPPYPWNHDKTYWHESHLGEANRFRKYPRQDLIGAPTADSVPFQPRWRGFLRLSENPWLQDHQVQKTIIYPAAGMVAIVLEAAKQISSESSGILGYEISNMKIEKAMIVPSTSHGLETALNMKLSETDDGKGDVGSPTGSAEFSIYSKQLDGPWERNASGFLKVRYLDDSWDLVLRSHNAAYQNAGAACTEAMAPRQLYELLDTVGMNYGFLFQNIVDVRKGTGSCVSKIRIPDTKAKMPAQFEYPHLLHPATLDSMFQTLFAIDPVPMVPTFIESLFVSADIADTRTGHEEYFAGHSTARRLGVKDAQADIVMRLGQTQSHVIVKGLVLTSLADSTPEDGGFLPNHRNLCTEIVWKEDVAFSNQWPVPLLDYVGLWAHKYPGVSILQVGGACSLTLVILDHLAPVQRGPFKLSRFTIANLDPPAADRTIRLVANTPVAQAVEVVKIDGSEPLADFDLVLVDHTAAIETDHLKKHLRPNGRMLKIASHDGTVLAEPVENTNLHSPQETLDVVILHPERCSVDIRWLISWLLEYAARQGLGEMEFSAVSRHQIAENPSLVSDRIVLSLLDFDMDGEHGSSIFEWREADFDFFHAVQKTAGGIVWLTQGAQMQCQNPRASPIVGLARTLMSEDPLKTIVSLDLDIKSQIDCKETCDMILFVLSRTFADGARGGVREMEYTEKNGRLYIPRLDLVRSLNELIEGGDGSNVKETTFYTEDTDPTALKLTITKPGPKSDGVCFTEVDRRHLGPLDVEIAFNRTILSFLDTENALGHTIDSTVGMDIVGHVVRKGDLVVGLKTGDQVMALVSGGAIQSSVIVDSCFVTPFKPGLVPSCLVSAHFALFHTGRARGGSTVLVHAGASTHGFAAMQLCFLVGAEVFVTVMGSNVAGQRDMLEKTGLPSHYIIDANSGSFVDVISERTRGRGVDIVYNPTQEHVDLGAACVRRSKFGIYLYTN